MLGALKLNAGEAILKEASESHFLRPGESSVGRLCRAYLTQSRLLFREAYYDVAEMKEAGLGPVFHEIALKDVDAARVAPGDGEPVLELEASGFEGRREFSYLCFRDKGWYLGESERRDERDYWLKAILQRLAALGRASNPVKRPVVAPRVKAVTSPAGTLVGGKYEIVRQIGEGGMGHVFLAKDRTLARRVAIKKMRPELLSLPNEIEMFLGEARMSAALHHPFIADIYEILEAKGEIILVFEYLDGKTLEQAISDKGRLTPREVKKILRCVCAALSYAHSEGVAHRDLKPSNIMLTKNGYAKVTDFGVARHMKEITSRSYQSDNAGTMAYMAPEQELGKFGPQSDLYSLGVTAYEMLSGEMPFVGPNFYLQKEKASYPPLDEVSGTVPEDLRVAVERCLSFDPGKRFESVDAFARAIGVEEAQ